MNLVVAKQLGGGSSHNTMVWNLGCKHDWDEWEQLLGLKDWGYEKMLPFLKKIERFENAGRDGNRGKNGMVEVKVRGSVGVNQF